MTRTVAAPWNRAWAMVEISASVDDNERVELIRAAYRSSLSGLVALALRGVSRQSVDRALDGVVDGRLHGSAGVIYLDANELREDVITAAGCASVIIASTEGFRKEMQLRGIRTVGVEDGRRLLLQSAPVDSRAKDKIA